MRITIEFDHGEERDAHTALAADKLHAALQAFAYHLRSQVKHLEPEAREDAVALRESFFRILTEEGVEIE